MSGEARLLDDLKRATVHLRGPGPTVPRLAPAPLAGTPVILDPVTRASDDLANHLATLRAHGQETALLDLVRGHAAAVLGHDDARSIGVGKGFADLGMDSAGALELRNRLATETGLRLPDTLVFDYPNPWRLARFLLAELAPPLPPAVGDAAGKRRTENLPVGEPCRAGPLDARGLARTSCTNV